MNFLRVIRRYIEEGSNDELIICRVFSYSKAQNGNKGHKKTSFKYKILSNGHTRFTSKTFNNETDCTQEGFDSNIYRRI